jgi:hypothetical protein
MPPNAATAILEAVIADLLATDPTIERTALGLRIGPVVIPVPRGGDRLLRALEDVAVTVKVGGVE